MDTQRIEINPKKYTLIERGTFRKGDYKNLFMQKIGIDPDTDKSGVCLIEDGKLIELHNLDLTDTFAFIDSHPQATVYIEAGWLNKKAVFYKAQNKAIAGRQGVQVGRNHAIGQQIEKYCLKMARKYILRPPTQRKWDAKWFKMITKHTGRTNQEQRDAVRAAW